MGTALRSIQLTTGPLLSPILLRALDLSRFRVLLNMQTPSITSRRFLGGLNVTCIAMKSSVLGRTSIGSHHMVETSLPRLVVFLVLHFSMIRSTSNRIQHLLTSRVPLRRQSYRQLLRETVLIMTPLWMMLRPGLSASQPPSLPHLTLHP